MRIQNAPKSTSKKTIVAAFRSAGGYWSTHQFVAGDPCHSDDYLGIVALFEGCDECYFNVDGEDISLEEFRGIMMDSCMAGEISV